MSDQVKAEIEAVRRLRSGVLRYRDRVCAAADAARHDMRLAQAGAERQEEARRQDFARTQRALEQARAAAAGAHEADRTRIQQEVASKQSALGDCTSALADARRQVQQFAEAANELSRRLHQVEAVVAEQSSSAESILTHLDIKLSDLVAKHGAGSWAQARTTFEVIVQVAAGAVGVSKVAGNVSQGYLPTAEPATTISQRTEDQLADQQQQWAEAEKRRWE